MVTDAHLPTSLSAQVPDSSENSIKDSLSTITDTAPNTKRTKRDTTGMRTWLEIETILQHMYLFIQRTEVDLDSIAVALRKVRRLQRKLKVAIEDHIEFHLG